MSILLLCAITWIVMAVFVYLAEDSARLAAIVGAGASVWIGAVLLFLQMAGR